MILFVQMKTSFRNDGDSVKFKMGQQRKTKNKDRIDGGAKRNSKTSRIFFGI